MSWRAAGLALLFAGRAALAGAQGTITVRDAGTGPGTDIVPRALASPYTVVPVGATAYTVRKGTTVDKTMFVVGRDAVVEGDVRGDIIVINGDLYIHPGAVIDGRVIAIGGGFYNSTLAHVGAGGATIRDFSYDVAPVEGGFSLTYRSGDEPPARDILQGFHGLVVPSYDRTNGLSVPAAAAFVFGKHLVAEPRATYRSQLGRIDGWIDIADTVGSSALVSVAFGRGTFTNDGWIYGNLVNSLESFFVGNDARNYFRGTRGEARFVWTADTGSRNRGGYIGFRGEHALTARPGFDPASGPWSVVGRRGKDDMLRPNPAIDNGFDNSLLLGTFLQSTETLIRGRAGVDLELGRATFDVPAGTPSPDARGFAQLTFDGSIEFPTFGIQSLRFDGHAVVSSHGGAPRQRWAYLGGSGTLPTLELLSLGGDQLAYLDSRYSIPLTRFEVPLLGAPVVVLRDAIGGAGVGKIATLHQNVGGRLAFGPAYIEIMVDPATRLGHFGGGISLRR